VGRELVGAADRQVSDVRQLVSLHEERMQKTIQMAVRQTDSSSSLTCIMAAEKMPIGIRMKIIFRGLAIHALFSL